MKTLLCGVLALACIPLAACDEKTLASACALKDAAYSDWQLYAAATSPSASTAQKVDLAYASATTLCKNPPKDAVSAIVTVSNLAVQIAIAVKTQKQKHPQVVVPTSLKRVVEMGAR